MRMILADAKTVVLSGTPKDAEALNRFFHMFDGRQRVVDLYLFGDGKKPMLRLTFGRPRKSAKR